MLDDIKEQLKQFVTGSQKHHDVTYHHYFHNCERHMAFGITSKANDIYFFVDSVNNESNVSAYYKLFNMDEEQSTTVEVTNICPSSCMVKFKELDDMTVKIELDSERAVHICLL